MPIIGTQIFPNTVMMYEVFLTNQTYPQVDSCWTDKSLSNVSFGALYLQQTKKQDFAIGYLKFFLFKFVNMLHYGMPQ